MTSYKQNFRVSIDEIQNTGAEKKDYKVKVNKPPVKVKLIRIQKTHELVEKRPQNGLSLELDQVDTEKYRITEEEYEGLESSQPVETKDQTEERKRREFSQLTLSAEIARYLNRSPLEIENILKNTQEGMAEVLRNINEFNQLLYDWVIPRLFNALYDLKEDESHEPEEIELVKEPEEGYYTVRANPDLVVTDDEPEVPNYKHKSFHLDTYAFDSQPEHKLFWSLLADGKVKKVYFTGMLTHGQSDFYIQYIDPESHAVRRYYPDFLMQKDDDSWVIVEVKGDNKIDDQVVLAKADAAKQRATASQMSYEIIKGSDANKGKHQALLE